MAYTYGAVTLTDDTVLECLSLSEIRSLSPSSWATTWTTTIDGQTISNTDIKAVEIGTSVPSLYRLFCYGCSNLETVVLSSSLSDIGEVFLWGCDSLSSLDVKNRNPNIVDTNEEAVLGEYSLSTTNGSAPCYVNGVSLKADSAIILDLWLNKFPKADGSYGAYRNLVSAIKLYGSVNGQSKLVRKLYGSVNGQTKEIKKLYGSVNGQTKLIYSA